jgi:hypothetical protein
MLIIPLGASFEDPVVRNDRMLSDLSSEELEGLGYVRDSSGSFIHEDGYSPKERFRWQASLGGVGALLGGVGGLSLRKTKAGIAAPVAGLALGAGIGTALGSRRRRKIDQSIIGRLKDKQR